MDINVKEFLKVSNNQLQEDLGGFSIDKVLRTLYGEEFSLTVRELNIENVNLSCYSPVLKNKKINPVINSLGNYRLANNYTYLFECFFSLNAEVPDYTDYIFGLRKNEMYLINDTEISKNTLCEFNLLDDIFIITTNNYLKKPHVIHYKSLCVLDFNKLNDMDISDESIKFLVKNYCYIKNIMEVEEDFLNEAKKTTELKSLVLNKGFKLEKIYETETETIYLHSEYYHRPFIFEEGYISEDLKDCICIQKKKIIQDNKNFDFENFFTDEIMENFKFSLSNSELECAITC